MYRYTVITTKVQIKEVNESGNISNQISPLDISKDKSASCVDAVVLKSIPSVSSFLVPEQESRRVSPAESNFDFAMRQPNSLTSCGPSAPHLHSSQTYYPRPPAWPQSSPSFVGLLSQRLDAYCCTACLFKLKVVFLGAEA